MAAVRLGLLPSDRVLALGASYERRHDVNMHIAAPEPEDSVTTTDTLATVDSASTYLFNSTPSEPSAEPAAIGIRDVVLH